MDVVDMQRLLNHAGRLAFGILATNGEPPEMDVRIGGSGIFIAPFLGISARHVSRDFYALDKAGDPGFFEGRRQAEHAPALFQVLEPSNPASPKALWHGGHSWDFFHTDICIYQVSAEDETSDRMQYTWPMRFFDLALLPPPVGTVVYALGFPGAKVEAHGPALHIDANVEFREGRVTEVYSPYRDRVMVDFPSFAIEMECHGGFSGGPVFWDGKLCGLISDEWGDRSSMFAPPSRSTGCGARPPEEIVGPTDLESGLGPRGAAPHRCFRSRPAPPHPELRLVL